MNTVFQVFWTCQSPGVLLVPCSDIEVIVGDAGGRRPRQVRYLEIQPVEAKLGLEPRENVVIELDAHTRHRNGDPLRRGVSNQGRTRSARGAVRAREVSRDFDLARSSFSLQIEGIIVVKPIKRDIQFAE